jgi:hypothetical protein
MINILNWDSFNEAYNKPRSGGKKRWSVKYKRSIDCSNAKDFSQKQYCKRKRKGGGYKNESIENNFLSEDERKYHLDEIKSIFQDYIDEYNIDELPDDLDENDDSRPGIYYHISDFSEIADRHRRSNGVLRRPQFELTLYCAGQFYLNWYLGDKDWTEEDAKEKNVLWYKYFKLIEEDISKFVERLREVGYIVKYEIPEDILDLVDDDEFNIFISLEKFTS